MSWILTLAATALGGWIGWALGEHFGVFTAYLLSVVGSAVALFWTRRFTRNLFG
jgi:hypothetical protein